MGGRAYSGAVTISFSHEVLWEDLDKFDALSAMRANVTWHYRVVCAAGEYRGGIDSGGFSRLGGLSQLLVVYGLFKDLAYVVACSNI